MSTVGYGNEYVQPLMIFLLIWILLCVAFVIPSEVGKLVNIISSKSKYARAKYKIVDKVPFIVILGAISQVAICDFFTEFFHEDHGLRPRHAVIIQPENPEPYMMMLINQGIYKNKIFYIQGDSLKSRDLDRAKIEHASSIIILCNKKSNDLSEEDSKTILQAMILKQHLERKKLQREPKLCLQFIRNEGKKHYKMSVNKN